MMEKFAIAIPTYNEAENIEKLIFSLKQLFSGIKIFVIDDNSPDGTSGIVEKLVRQFSGITLIQQPKKSGLASAYISAFNEILKDNDIDYVVTMDADFSHHPNDLKKLLELMDNYDLVIGSRYVLGGKIENWSPKRRRLSYFGNHYARWITGVPIADLTAGFVVYKRNLLERILDNGIKSEGYAYQIEMKYLAHKYNASIKEIPITFKERDSGVSKLDKGVVWEGIIAPWRLRFFR